MTEIPKLYTPEVVIFRSRLNKANLTTPITVYTDSEGNHALVHGNHRAYKSYVTGQEVEREIIGSISKDVSNDPNYHPISELKIIER